VPQAAGLQRGTIDSFRVISDIAGEVITLSVNGQPRTLEAGASVARLVETLALQGKRIAVEKNGEIVPRSRYPETALKDGDQLEIVVAVGGG
jgi:sulfur carrier protein